MRNLWKGEVKCKQSLPKEQGDYALLNSHLTNIPNLNGETSNKLESFEFLQGDVIEDKNLLQPLQNNSEKVLKFSLEVLQRCQQIPEMATIIGTYQHERNENLDEYFKAVGVPYIPRKMMCMSHPRLEISNEGDKWTIRTISMIRTIELTFTLGEEYEEHMPNGVTLKNVTTKEDGGLVTVSVGPDNSKVVRKYDVTEDGVLLTMTHENSGQIAKRYFKRLT